MLLFGRILLNGEVILVKNGKEPAFFIKEQDVGHHCTILIAAVGECFVISAESVEVIGAFHTVDGLCLVQTFKQSAVEERHFGKHVNYLLFRYTEHFGITVQRFDVLLCGSGKFARVALLVYDSAVEGGKEKVLQNSVVVISSGGAFRVEVLQNGFKVFCIEKPIGHKVLLLDEPHKHDAGNHANDFRFEVVAVVILSGSVVGK